MLYFIWGQIPMNYELQIDQFQSSMTNALLLDHQNMIYLIQFFIKVIIYKTGAGKLYFEIVYISR